MKPVKIVFQPREEYFTGNYSQMTIDDSLYIFRSAKILRSQLKSIYSSEEAENIMKIWTEFVTDRPWHRFLMDREAQFSPKEFEKFYAGIPKLMEKTPVQYLTGTAWFYGRPFAIGPGVLIPRPETEELAEWILNNHQDNSPKVFADFCSGSGCIGVTIGAERPDSFIYLVDAFPDPVQYSTQNLQTHNINGEVCQYDLLDVSPNFSRILDVIVSNPPYVLESDKSFMDENVLAFEPSEALFVPDQQPLLFYRRIAQIAMETLRSGGWLYFEIHENFGQEVVEMMKEVGFEGAEIKKDLSGKDRMVRGQKPM